MAILICGGAGYIGSHVNKSLNGKGHETVVLDNLSRGHREAVKWGTFEQGDLLQEKDLERVFQKHEIEAVMHFAAFAYVGESMGRPEEYYENNVAGTLNLLKAMRRHGCDKLVFSSTCATYGEPERVPIDEDQRQNPINPYGASKLMVEWILQDYERAYGMRSVALRYFNAAGADPEGEIGESHEPETHLIPLVLAAATGERPGVQVMGTDYDTPDGSCVRDYVHVTDLAEAHVLALEHLNQGGGGRFNLGNERGTSVLEIIEAAKEVTGEDFPVVKASRRPGDPAVLVGSGEKAKRILGWEPCHQDIEEIVSHAWAWHRHRTY